VWAPALIAFLLVALAELGDKSQLLLLAFAARYEPRKVAIGAALAIAVLQLIAVAAGSAIGTLLPTRAIAVAAGVLFIVFGVTTWLGTRATAADGDEGAPSRPARFGPVLTVALAFLVGELGDKTQLMTVSIAADPAAAMLGLGALAPSLPVPAQGPLTTFGVWLGSSLGMFVADAVAIVIGGLLGARLPVRLIGRFSAVVFLAFGVLTVLSGVGVLGG